jgi:hypothetical protein
MYSFHGFNWRRHVRVANQLSSKGRGHRITRWRLAAMKRHALPFSILLIARFALALAGLMRAMMGLGMVRETCSD